ncbi:flagellar motor switch protein FliM [Pseudooceanicola aestuarii]|uniref:flagellar motor switch protein FliM n=1 Tax=Pseudooceanicola aestuarii TaxID=2697319 RepID=UPI0013D7C9DF|nr:FliM/FliN family flagellar motor switch protein [Pseudooceanicola aestuarii]
MTGLRLSEETRAVEELIIERAKSSYARLPVMEVVLDRFALGLGPALKAYLGALAEVSLKRLDYMSCHAAIQDLPNPGLFAVAEAPEWAGPISLAVKADLLFAVLDLTFGGRAVSATPQVNRTLTGIEKRVGQAVAGLALDELSNAFRRVSPVEFEINLMETAPRSLLLAPPNSPCVRAVVEVEAEGRTGELELILPNISFEPAHDILSQNFTGGQLGGDTGWRKKMSGMLGDTSVSVLAVMKHLEIPLRHVLEWTPGTVLPLNMDENDPVTLSCTGEHVAMAEVGSRKNGRIALKLTQVLSDEEETADVPAT